MDGRPHLHRGAATRFGSGGAGGGTGGTHGGESVTSDVVDFFLHSVGAKLVDMKNVELRFDSSSLYSLEWIFSTIRQRRPFSVVLFTFFFYL